jgi:hypothetical protein
MKASVLRVLWILGCATTIFAQQKVSDEAVVTTTVSGHVYCADTNAPARMANVILQPAEAIDALKPGEENHVSSHGESVQTLLDGSFTIQHVPPGTYYVIASEPGYISPVASLFVAASDDATTEDNAAKRISRSSPRITVQSNLPVAVNVTLERGAAVSGTVLYDDGSPASGLLVTVLIHLKDQWLPIPPNTAGHNSSFAGTDDQGNYRISGLPARDYLLKAELRLSKSIYSTDAKNGTSMSMNTVYSLAIYSGNKMRAKDATPFSLTSGEDRHGEDVEIPISRIHSVRGSLAAARDGHGVNGGQLSLLYPDDKSEASHTSLTKDDDGFSFSFVPEGDYILRVNGPTDNEYVEIPNAPHSMPPTRTEMHTVRSYGSVDYPLHVGSDVTGVVVAVPDLPGQKSQ